MPSWKKVIVSGSSPHFNEITASGNVSGSLTSTASFQQYNITSQHSGSQSGGKIYQRSNDLIIEGVDGENVGDITFRTGHGAGVRDVAHIDYAGAMVIGASATIPADNHSGGGGSLTVFNTGTSIIKIANNTTGQDANSGTDLQITSGTDEFKIINREAADIELVSNSNKFIFDASANTWSGSLTSTGSFGKMQIEESNLAATARANADSLIVRGADSEGVGISILGHDSYFKNLNFGGTNSNRDALISYSGTSANKMTIGTTRASGIINFVTGNGDVSFTLKGGTSGVISGSSTSTGSFGHLLVGGSTVGSSPDATDGSQNTISGSITSTGSFGSLVVPDSIKGGLTINQSGGARGLIIHAEDSSHSYLQISNTTTGTTTGDGLQFGILSDESGFIAHQENNYLRFDTNATERFRITADGDIGIGETSPDELLHLKQTANDFTTVKVESTNAGNSAGSQIQLTNDGASFWMVNHAVNRTVTRYGITVGGFGEILAQDSNSGLLIGTGTKNKPIIFGTNNTEVMRIENGKVSGSINSTGSFGHLMLDGGNFTSASLASAGGISNIVEDTTPQLGGNLDTNDNDLVLSDTNRLYYSGSLGTYNTDTIVAAGWHSTTYSNNAKINLKRHGSTQVGWGFQPSDQNNDVTALVVGGSSLYEVGIGAFDGNRIPQYNLHISASNTDYLIYGEGKVGGRGIYIKGGHTSNALLDTFHFVVGNTGTSLLRGDGKKVVFHSPATFFSGSGEIQMTGSLVGTSAEFSNYVGDVSGSSTSTGSFGKLEVGTNVRLRDGEDSFINGGDFGIGTTTPVARLEIEDNSTTNAMLLKLTSDDTNVYGMVIGNDTFSTTDTNGGQHIVSNDGIYIIRTIGAGSAAKTRIGAGTAYNNYSYLEITGSVAEFTTTTISGSITSTGSFGSLNTGQIIVSGSAFTSDIIQIYNDAAGQVGYAGITFDLDNSTNDAEAYLRLDRTSGTKFLGLTMQSDGRDGMRFMTGTTERLRIDGDEVSGSITSTGSFGALKTSGDVHIGTSGSVPFHSGGGLGIRHATTARIKLQTESSGSDVASGFELVAGSTASIINRDNRDLVIFGSQNIEHMRFQFNSAGERIGIFSGDGFAFHNGDGLQIGGGSANTESK